MHQRKKVDPRVIGIFVVGAIILCVAGILFFGPGGLLTDTKRYIIYFESSVKGLNVGSPVRFRGVKIGQVREINIRFEQRQLAFNIPVVIEIEPKKIKADGSDKGLLDHLMTTVQGEDPIVPLITGGLRAQLQLDSLVTGQLYVNLDMFPEAPAVQVRTTGDYQAIPAVSSSFEELSRTLEELPLQLLADKLIQSAEGAQRIFTSPSLHSGIEQIDAAMTSLNQLLTTMNDALPPLLTGMEETLTLSRSTLTRLDDNVNLLLVEARTILSDAGRTISTLDAEITPLARSIDRSMAAVSRAADNVTATMQDYKNLIDTDSPLLQQFSLTMQQLHGTMESLRYLADELERDPQMLLRGRATEK